MMHVDTRYEVTLRKSDGTEFPKVKALFDGTFSVGKEMWGNFLMDENRCYIKFQDFGRDKEMYAAGFYKVVKMERVDIYEERTTQIL